MLQFNKQLCSHDTSQWADKKVTDHNVCSMAWHLHLPQANCIFFPYTYFKFDVQPLKKPSIIFFVLNYTFRDRKELFFFSSEPFSSGFSLKGLLWKWRRCAQGRKLFPASRVDHVTCNIISLPVFDKTTSVFFGSVLNPLSGEQSLHLTRLNWKSFSNWRGQALQLLMKSAW